MMTCRLPFLPGFACLALALGGVHSSLSAEEAAPSAPSAPGAGIDPVADGAPKVPSSEDLRRWIRQLEADDFATRREAKEQLVAAGDAAVEAIRDAAAGASVQLASECVNILRQFASRPEGDAAPPSSVLEDRARAALDELARSPSRDVAALAQDALRDPRIPERPARPGLLGGGFALNAAVNRARSVEITSRGQRIKISDKGGKEIVVELSRTVDGKATTRKVEAADLANLKQKDAEAAALYEKYFTPNGIRILGGVGAQPPLLPQPINPAAPPGVEQPVPREGKKAAKESKQSKRSSASPAEAPTAPEAAPMNPGPDPLKEAVHADPQQLEAVVEQFPAP